MTGCSLCVQLVSCDWIVLDLEPTGYTSTSKTEGDASREHNDASLKCLYETALAVVSIVILMTTISIVILFSSQFCIQSVWQFCSQCQKHLFILNMPALTWPLGSFIIINHSMREWVWGLAGFLTSLTVRADTRRNKIKGCVALKSLPETRVYM